MKIFKRSLPFVLGVVLLSPGLFAQGQQMQTTQPDSITDKELKKFVNTANELQTIQQETRQEVETLVEEEGMKFERFREIIMSKQDPKVTGDVEVTQKENKIIQNVQPQLMKINNQAQKQFVQAIQDEGLSPQRFQQIMQAVRSDPEVSQRFQKMASDTAGTSEN